MRRPPIALDATLTGLLLLGVPLALFVATGSPASLTHQLPRHALSGAALVAWLLWLWCVAGVGVRVVRRVRRKDLQVSNPARRLDRLSAALAGLILMIAAWCAPLTAEATVSQGLAGLPAPPQLVSSTAPIASQSNWPDASTYLVQPGDCLWTIAEQLYGDGDLWTMLASANLGHLMSGDEIFTDPSLIRPGWQLEVPSLAVPASPAPSESLPPASAALAPAPATHHHAAPALSEPPNANTVTPSSSAVGDGSVVIASGVGAGLLLFSLLRRRVTRRRRHPSRVDGPLVDVEIAAARLGPVPLATMAERAVWLADADNMLDEAVILELTSSEARLFAAGAPRWRAPAAELLDEVPFVNHAPALIIPLGEQDGSSWSLIVPRGCTVEVAGRGAERLFELALSLQAELAWGSMVVSVESSLHAEQMALECDEGVLLVSRGAVVDHLDPRVSQLVVTERADVRVDEGLVTIDSLGLSFEVNDLQLSAPETDPPPLLAADATASAWLPDSRLDDAATSVVGEPDVIVRLLCCQPRIDGSAQPVEPKRSRRATELLAYLALHHPDPVTSDRLRSRVLGSSTTDAASKTLFNVSSALRRALGEQDGEPILPRASRSGLYRSGAMIACDVTMLEASVDAAESADGELALALYREALNLIESEPLATALVGYEWFDAEGHRGRLEAYVERAGLALAELALGHALPALAGFALTKAQLVVPYSEALAEMAMEVAGAQRDANGLRRAFGELARIVEELDPGRSPSLSAEQHYEALRKALREEDYASLDAIDEAPLSTSPSAPAAL
jgi:DNA-binding SARP family transcriptional activator